MRLGCLVSLALGLWLAAGAAHAQDDRVRLAQARSAFEEGVRHLDEQRFDAAATAFERSLALRESATVRYDLAIAYRGMGRLRAAAATLRHVLATPAEASRVPADAPQILAAVEQALAHVTVHLHGQVSALSLDGEPLPTADGQRVELDTGHHVFVARGPGAPVHEEVDVVPGTDGEVTLTVGEDLGHLARLRVHALPPEARLSIDGVVQGSGDLALTVPAGQHELRATAIGYRALVRQLDLAAGHERRLEVTLEAESTVWASPWLWTSVALVAVAGIATALVFALSSTTFFAPDAGSTGVVAMAAVAR